MSLLFGDREVVDFPMADLLPANPQAAFPFQDRNDAPLPAECHRRQSATEACDCTCGKVSWDSSIKALSAALSFLRRS